MSDADDVVALRAYLRRDSVLSANSACTLAVLNLLILPVGLASPSLLIVPTFLGFLAWRLGRRATQIQDQFQLGSNYRTSAQIGKWLGAIEFVIGGLLLVAILASM